MSGDIIGFIILTIYLVGILPASVISSLWIIQNEDINNYGAYIAGTLLASVWPFLALAALAQKIGERYVSR